jgi:hypothetical protein
MLFLLTVRRPDFVAPMAPFSPTSRSFSIPGLSHPGHLWLTKSKQLNTEQIAGRVGCRTSMVNSRLNPGRI